MYNPQFSNRMFPLLSVTLDNMIGHSSFQQLSQVYKSMCKKLVYYIHSIGLKPINPVTISTLKACIEKILLLLDSLEYHKFGHILPLLKWVVDKFKRTTGYGVENSKFEQVIKRNELNFKSCKLKSCQSIKESEINFLKSSEINQIFYQILNGQIVLQNNQCICCSQVYYKDAEIKNNNLALSTIVDIPTIQGSFKTNFQRYLCGLYNVGGGALVIGAKRVNGKLISKGIRFASQKQCIEIEQQICQSFKSIQPLFQYNVDRIVVQTNFIKPSKISHELFRFCYRIIVYPSVPERLRYIKCLQISNITSIFILDAQNKPIISQNFYPLIHYNKNKKSSYCLHQNIKFYIPLNNYSKLYLNSVDSNNINSASSEQEIKAQQVKFKFSSTSLIVFNRKDEDTRYIADIDKFLKKQKQGFQISQPFAHLYKEGLRSIWMISHSSSQKDFKELMKKAQIQKIIPGVKFLTVMPVKKYLRISQQFCTQIHEAQIQKQFSQKFKYKIVKEQKVFQNKSFLIYKFNDYTQSIYTYMLFEAQKLKPYFIEDPKN